MHTVGEVTQLTGVTVRTLHHYDEIGLLAPSARSESGYRLYDHGDLERLQEILVWRQLGFTLEQTGALLDDPAHDRLQALRRQRALIAAEHDRLAATARALDAAIAAHTDGIPQEEDTMFAGFDPSVYEQEARERWGDTDAYRESARRSARYGPAEWAQIEAQAEAIEAEFADLLAAGEPADSPPARALAERHRRHIARWFYALSPAQHRGLAEMYIADPRFAAHYEQRRAGLAGYVHAAILANADGAPADAAASTR